jgi:hypothetical protein
MDHSQLAVQVTLLLALIGAVWRFSASNARLEKTTEALMERDEEMGERLRALERIPVLEQRIGQLEGTVSKATSIWPKLESRIALLEQRANRASTDKFQAVRVPRPSRPDPEET